jgi:hypothetical protein
MFCQIWSTTSNLFTSKALNTPKVRIIFSFKVLAQQNLTFYDCSVKSILSTYNEIFCQSSRHKGWRCGNPLIQQCISFKTCYNNASSFILARDKSYEMTSFVETVATTLLKQEPVEFVKYPLK